MIDLQIIVKERESGIDLDNYVLLSVTDREVGLINKLIHALKNGINIDFVDDGY